ncbi:Os02g0232050, partial [Oryza sativa Japonica Group]
LVAAVHHRERVRRRVVDAGVDDGVAEPVAAGVEAGEVDRVVRHERGGSCGLRAAAAGVEPVCGGGDEVAVAVGGGGGVGVVPVDEAAQHLRVADDLDEEGEHLLGAALRLLHAAPHRGDAALDLPLLPPQPRHLQGHHGALLVDVPGGRLPSAAATAGLLLPLRSPSAAAPSHDPAQQVRLAAQERHVRELPPVRINLAKPLHNP